MQTETERGRSNTSSLQITIGMLEWIGMDTVQERGTVREYSGVALRVGRVSTEVNGTGEIGSNKVGLGKFKSGRITVRT